MSWIVIGGMLCSSSCVGQAIVLGSDGRLRRIALEVTTDYGDEVMKVYDLYESGWTSVVRFGLRHTSVGHRSDGSDPPGLQKSHLSEGGRPPRPLLPPHRRLPRH